MRCCTADRCHWRRRMTASRNRTCCGGSTAASVYTVAGADLYTSQRILDAEQRLIATAGRHDGTTVDESAVDLALLEIAANGTALDAGRRR